MRAILLCGGDKTTQADDIDAAIALARETSARCWQIHPEFGSHPHDSGLDGSKVAFDDFPGHFDIHAQVSMGEQVAHAGDLFPRDGRLAYAEFLGAKVLDCS